MTGKTKQGAKAVKANSQKEETEKSREIFEVSGVTGSSCKLNKPERKRGDKILISIELPLEVGQEVSQEFVYLRIMKIKSSGNGVEEDKAGRYKFKRDDGSAVAVSYFGTIDMSSSIVVTGNKFFELYTDSAYKDLFAQSWKDAGSFIEFTHDPGFILVDECPK